MSPSSTSTEGPRPRTPASRLAPRVVRSPDTAPACVSSRSSPTSTSLPASSTAPAFRLRLLLPASSCCSPDHAPLRRRVHPPATRRPDSGPRPADVARTGLLVSTQLPERIRCVRIDAWLRRWHLCGPRHLLAAGGGVPSRARVTPAGTSLACARGTRTNPSDRNDRGGASETLADPSRIGTMAAERI
jgi:hypothetical protein